MNEPRKILTRLLKEGHLSDDEFWCLIDSLKDHPKSNVVLMGKDIVYGIQEPKIKI